jgi:hypothetical protein
MKSDERHRSITSRAPQKSPHINPSPSESVGRTAGEGISTKRFKLITYRSMLKAHQSVRLTLFNSLIDQCRHTIGNAFDKSSDVVATVFDDQAGFVGHVHNDATDFIVTAPVRAVLICKIDVNLLTSSSQSFDRQFDAVRNPTSQSTS